MGQLPAFVALLLPAVIGGGALLLLLLIFRRLARTERFRSLGLLYIFASLLFGVSLFLSGEGLLPYGWPRSLVLSILVVAWGYIGFNLFEFLLIERTLIRRGIPVPRLARDIVRGLVLIALMLLVVNQAFGVPLSSLVISSTVASAVVGLALQDLLKNVIAGVALQIERPFAPGDWVLINTQTAKVIEMSWRATRLVTVDNTHIILPNANLALAEFSNYSIVSPLQALHVQIALAPDHPPNLVKSVFVQAALNAEGVLSDPPPTVRLIAFGEYSLTYDIKFWMPDFDRYTETRDAVLTSAWYYARRAGFRLPTPQREMFVHESDTRFTRDEQQRRHSEIAGALGAIDLFSVLSAEERIALATRVELRIFGCGETLVRQGDRDDTLYVIRRGHVRVETQAEPGRPAVQVSELYSGDFFGELALLTGAPRGATVIAVDDTEAIIVHHDAVGPLIEQNPALAERLSEALERRLAENQTMLAASAAMPSPNGADLSQPGLLRMIRSWFGLG